MQITAGILLVAAIALAPGLVGYVWGRAILRRRHEPALAERLKRRLTWVLALGWMAILVSWVLGIGWLPGILAMAGAILSGFPLRRTLLEERWGLGRYLWFQVRIVGALVGFWLLLAVAPGLARSTEAPAVAALVAAAVLTGWNLAYRWLVRRLTGARPLTPEEERLLGPLLDRIDAASGVESVRRLVIPVPGGRFANAFALPGRDPVVMLSETVVHDLEPPEAAAIYAHEVAHLERLDVRQLRRRALAVWALVAAAVALPFAPVPAWVLGLGWPAAVLFALLALRPHAEELASDLRAAELCGDPEAVELALVKLHAFALLPRRLGPGETRYQTHPSLARRIRELRRASGSGAATAAAPTGDRSEAAGDGAATVVVRTPRPDQVVLLDDERITWLEGVPEAGGSDPAALRRAAATTRSVAYDRLTELRLEPAGIGRPLALVAREAGGTASRTPVAPEDAAALERALDRADARLGEHRPVPRSAGRLLAMGALVASFVPPVTFSAALLAGIAAARTGPATLAAAGAGGLAAALWSWRGPGAWPLFDLVPGRAWIASGGLALLSLLLVAAGLRWARRDPAAVRGRGWPVAGWLLALTAVLWAAILLQASGLFILHRAARSVPATLVFPAAAAGALLVAGQRRERLVAAAPVAMVCLALGIGSTGLRAVWLEDPLLTPGSPPRPATMALTPAPAGEMAIETGAELRLSPTGRSVAVLRWDVDGRSSWEVYRVAGAEPLARLEGLHLALPADDVALALRVSAAGGAGPVLEGRPLGAPEADGWELELPDLEEPALAVHGDRWTVWGTDPEDRSGGTFLLVAGDLAGRIGSRLRLPFRHGSEEPDVFPVWTPLGEQAALAVVHEWIDQTPLPIFPGVPTARLWRVDLQGAELLAESRSTVVCVPADGEAVCTARDGEWSHLWTVPAAGPPRPHGPVAERFMAVSDVRAGRAVLQGLPGMPPLLATLGPASLQTGVPEFADGVPPVDTRLVGTDRLAALFQAGDRSRVVLYELSAPDQTAGR